MQASELTALLKATFPDADITLVDTAGDKDHYDLKIASSAFAGKSRVEQHRMVMAALQGKMGTELHAMSITTVIR